MKDTIITARQKRHELITYAVCLGLAFLLNVYAIAHYRGTSWSELWTQLPWVLVWGTAIYVFWALLRWIFFGVKKLVCRKK